MTRTLLRRGAAAMATVTIVLTAAACNDFLRVKNPGAIEEPDLNNSTYIGLLVNGVIGEFQPAFTSVALYSAIFTDELANFHGFSENIDIDRRAVDIANGTYNIGVYTPLQSSRFLADSASRFLTRFLGDTAARDVRLARTLDYGGYSYLLMGEQLCAAPINGSAHAFTPDELLDTAVVRFNAAIQVATAAKAFNNSASADSLLNLARVGAARASLDLGNKTDAINFASAVPASFGFFVYHSANSTREYNPFAAAASGGQAAEFVGITNTPWENVNGDPRIPHPATTELTMQGSAIVPNSPINFSTYNGTATGADFTRAASVRFASGLEAQYIIAEAQGNTPANVAFVNSRIAIGGGTQLVAPTDAQYTAALRDQRARDLYLAGYRMGDLRRYEKLYGADLWQSGTFKSPVPAPPTFGTQKCWPIPQAEYTGNPNLPKP